MTPDAPWGRVCELDVGGRGGPLSHAEQRRRDEHVSSCDDCRVMARLNTDIDPLGDVRPGDEAVVAAAADLALSRLNRSESVGRRRAMPGLMVVVLVLGTSAGAVAARRQLARLASTVAEALYPARRALRSDQRVGPPVHSSSRPHSALAPVALNPTAELASTVPPVVPRIAKVSATVTATVPTAVAVAVAEPRRSRPFQHRDVPGSRSTGIPVAPTQVVPAEPPVSNEVPVAVEARMPPGDFVSTERPGQSSIASSPSLPPTASALLASGAAARARGDRAAAVAFFRQLQIQYPAATESQVGLVSSGQLLLDGGDFSGALAAFRAYRERVPAGPLVEEALDGTARALAGLGRANEERTVWREMITRFPGSAYLSRATRRLRALR